MDDTILGEEEISEVVMRLRLHRVGVPSGVKAEHLRMWNHKSKREEDPDPGNWDKFVALI